jgi:hypothetical protein|tara:strand:- start:517 stop:828 length:312 start_codon:yes stop_codon:yes gene_type:complete
MKFFLTVYICSTLAGNCFTTDTYPKPQDSYYDCVRNGLSESYDILYQGDFSEQDVVKYKMYPKFACEEVIVPPPKPKADEQPTSWSAGTILRGIFRYVTYNIN